MLLRMSRLLAVCSVVVGLTLAKPQSNIQDFYSNVFTEYGDGAGDDFEAIEGGDAGSGASGDGMDRDLESFMQQDYDIPSEMPVLLLRQMLVNSGYHEYFEARRRKRRQLDGFYVDIDYDYGSDRNVMDHVDAAMDGVDNEGQVSGDGHFRGGVQENLDIVFDENSHDIDTIISLVINHGCWCPKLEGHTPHEGKPLDEVDRACRDWSKCLHCSGLVGDCAAHGHLEHETFKVVYTGSEYYCHDEENSACMLEICQCTLDWATSTKAIVDAEGAKVQNEDIYTDVARDQCHKPLDLATGGGGGGGFGGGAAGSGPSIASSHSRPLNHTSKIMSASGEVRFVELLC